MTAAEVHDEAGDRGFGERVRGADLDPHPSAVAVAESQLDGVLAARIGDRVVDVRLPGAAVIGVDEAGEGAVREFVLGAPEHVLHRGAHVRERPVGSHDADDIRRRANERAEPFLAGLERGRRGALFGHVARVHDDAGDRGILEVVRQDGVEVVVRAVDEVAEPVADASGRAWDGAHGEERADKLSRSSGWSDSMSGAPYARSGDTPRTFLCDGPTRRPAVPRGSRAYGRSSRRTPRGHRDG